MTDVYDVPTSLNQAYLSSRMMHFHVRYISTPMMLGYGTIICLHSTAIFIYAVLGFFVPYFDREVILLPTPPCRVLAMSSHAICAHETYQVQCSSNQMVLHTRAILRSSASYHDD